MLEQTTPLPLPLRRRLEVTITRDAAGVTVLRATGELDLAGSSRLASRLNEVIWRPGGAVIIDLDVTMIDSTGLAVLLNALRRLDKAGRPLRIVSTQPTVQRILSLSRLGRQLPLAAHVTDAHAALAA